MQIIKAQKYTFRLKFKPTYILSLPHSWDGRKINMWHTQLWQNSHSQWKNFFAIFLLSSERPKNNIEIQWNIHYCIALMLYASARQLCSQFIYVSIVLLDIHLPLWAQKSCDFFLEIQFFWCHWKLIWFSQIFFSEVKNSRYFEF